MDDLTSVSQQLTTNSTSDTAAKFFVWVTVISLVLTFVIALLYVLHLIRRRKLEAAIFEIRDLLRDIKDNTAVAPAHRPLETAAVPGDKLNNQ